SLRQGIVLSNNRSSDDCVLVTVVATTEGNPSAVTTYAVTAEGERQQVSPGLYTDLEMGATPEPHEVVAAGAAVAAFSDDPDHSIAAVAYVRGTASPATASAWRTAREQLRDELTARGLDP